MSYIFERHEPVSECDCRECAIAERDRLLESIECIVRCCQSAYVIGDAKAIKCIGELCDTSIYSVKTSS